MAAKLILGSMTFLAALPIEKFVDQSGINFRQVHFREYDFPSVGSLAHRNVLESKVELISAKPIIGSMTFHGLALLPSETLCRLKKHLDSFCGQDFLVVNKRVCKREV